MEYSDETIARIERELKAERWSVRALCDEAGVSPSTWTKWKAGKSLPSIRVWRKIVAAHEKLTKRAA